YYPKDWSGYVRFRADVKCQGSPLGLRVVLEDGINVAHYTIMRVFEVPADKWVTVEVDLADLARPRPIGGDGGRNGKEKPEGRLLNLAEMANVWISIAKVEAKCAVKLDNLRLLTAGAEKGETRLTVITDDRPLAIPEPLPPGKPTPRAPVEGKLNRAALEWEKPVELPLKSGSYGLQLVDVAPVDNDRMLMAVASTSVLKTVDGGKTWTGLDGTANKPTRVIDHDTNAPGRAAAAMGPDVMVLGVAKCSGGGIPIESYSVLTSFKGGSWKPGKRGLVDVDDRHCPEHGVHLARQPDGRIWACWMHRPRTLPHFVAARYSDDGGATWRDAASNAQLKITSRGQTNLYGMTWWQQKPDMPGWAPRQAVGRVADIHPHSRPQIAPWGEHAVVVFGKGGKLYCSFFTGEKWDAAVATGITGEASSLCHFEGETVYLAATDGEVYRLEALKWVKDSPPGGVGKGRLGYPGCRKTRLSAAGKVLVAAWTDGKKLFTSARPGDGTGGWSKPREIFNEERGVHHLGVPVRSVENFVPLVWSISGKNAGARFVRIPVKQP
ncbi:MAG: beta propeller repeat protein, partial [Planctomycetota bacterium]